MKIALLTLSLLVSTHALAENMNIALSYNDSIQVKKTVMMDEILIDDLIKLHNDFDFDGDRMIAGKFETKTQKKSYIDGLRSKLEGCKSVMRF
jgi:hypothetical protein